LLLAKDVEAKNDLLIINTTNSSQLQGRPKS